MDAPQSKTPGGSRGQFAEQGTLFEPPPFSPVWPNNATKEGQLLEPSDLKAVKGART